MERFIFTTIILLTMECRSVTTTKITPPGATNQSISGTLAEFADVFDSRHRQVESFCSNVSNNLELLSARMVSHLAELCEIRRKEETRVKSQYASILQGTGQDSITQLYGALEEGPYGGAGHARFLAKTANIRRFYTLIRSSLARGVKYMDRAADVVPADKKVYVVNYRSSNIGNEIYLKRLESNVNRMLEIMARAESENCTYLLNDCGKNNCIVRCNFDSYDTCLGEFRSGKELIAEVHTHHRKKNSVCNRKRRCVLVFFPVHCPDQVAKPHCIVTPNF